jgi:lipopolysaccharide/colanic/teichoic acid biosynthesis glycosyltransferase
VPDGKRLFDLAVCAVATPVVAVPGLLIAAAVRALYGPPVLHRGRRMGRGGREFEILKFRTMTVATGGSAVTAAGDPRVTRLGGWLRRTKLDELPQLVNVLRGEMSLVGPRPEDPRFARHYRDRYAAVLSVRPGITGPAAVRFRHEEELLRGVADPEEHYEAVLLPAKLDLDLDYVRHHSIRVDLAILADTVRAVLSGSSGRTAAGR